MKKLISIRLASTIIITVNTLALFMHFLILLNILPHDFVWGGRLQNKEDIIIFESISIIVQLLFISIILIKAGYILIGKYKKTANFFTWILFGLMVLNTLGNLSSNSDLEKWLMTPLTIVLALMVYRLAIEK